MSMPNSYSLCSACDSFKFLIICAPVCLFAASVVASEPDSGHSSRVKNEEKVEIKNKNYVLGSVSAGFSPTHTLEARVSYGRARVQSRNLNTLGWASGIGAKAHISNQGWVSTCPFGSISGIFSNALGGFTSVMRIGACHNSMNSFVFASSTTSLTIARLLDVGYTIQIPLLANRQNWFSTHLFTLGVRFPIVEIRSQADDPGVTVVNKHK
jgi:hypothetical protein